MYLTVTAAAGYAGVSRTTIYEKIKTGELSKTPDGIDIAEMLRVFGPAKNDHADPRSEKVEGQGDELSIWLREKLDSSERELKQIRSELTDTAADLADTLGRLSEHREAAMLLEHKNDDADRKLKKAQERINALESRGLIDRLFNRKTTDT